MVEILKLLAARLAQPVPDHLKFLSSVAKKKWATTKSVLIKGQ